MEKELKLARWRLEQKRDETVLDLLASLQRPELQKQPVLEQPNRLLEVKAELNAEVEQEHAVRSLEFAVGKQLGFDAMVDGQQLGLDAKKDEILATMPEFALVQ